MCNWHHFTNCCFQINADSRNNQGNNHSINGDKFHSNVNNRQQGNCYNYCWSHLSRVNVSLNKSNQLQNGDGFDRYDTIVNSCSIAPVDNQIHYCNGDTVDYSFSEEMNTGSDAVVETEFLQSAEGVKFNRLECTPMMIMNSLWDNNMLFCYRDRSMRNARENNNNNHELCYPLLNKRRNNSISSSRHQSRGGINVVYNNNKFKSVFLVLIILFAFCVNIAGGGKIHNILCTNWCYCMHLPGIHLIDLLNGLSLFEFGSLIVELRPYLLKSTSHNARLSLLRKVNNPRLQSLKSTKAQFISV